MRHTIEHVLRELEEHGRAHDAAQTVHAQRMLNLEPETAKLLYIMLGASGCRSVLEIGTSNGYSTIWIAAAMEANDGRVVSVDRSQTKQTMADQNLTEAGLRHRVDLRQGDATELIGSLGMQFDAVFFDADRVSAPTQLAMLLPKLTTKVLLFADNVLSHPEEIQGYLDAVSSLEGFTHLVVPVGKGLSVAYRGCALK